MVDRTYFLIGQRMGRLQVLAEAGRTSYGDRWYLCVCDCGNFCRAPHRNMVNGNLKSCGCLAMETRRQNGLNLKGRSFAKGVKTDSKAYSTDLFKAW